jgi:hypothetical protein
MTMKLLAFVPLLVLLDSASATAQGVDPGRVSFGAAAGISDPLHGDFGFRAPSWEVDVRLNTWTFLASSVFVEQWRHTDEDVSTNVITPTGRIDRLTRARTDQTRVVGWSLLGKSNGRVAVNGGGGVSYLLYSRESSTKLEGCTPASLCGASASDFDNGAFAAQVQAGVDVRVIPRLAVTGNFRLVAPVEDPGAGHITFLAGARLIF